jgi:hypothetical protein
MQCINKTNAYMQVSRKPLTERSRVPGPPRLIMRSATAIIMAADPWRQPKGQEKEVCVCL